MNRKTVQKIRDGQFEFVQDLVPCGKRGCTKCPHGPYWYARAWKAGRVREIYVGKSLAAWTETKGLTLLERVGILRQREDLLEEEIK